MFNALSGAPRPGPVAALLAYALLLLAPALALAAGALPFSLRFHILAAVAGAAFAGCAAARCSARDLGLAGPGGWRAWGVGALVTAALIALLLIETRLPLVRRPPPDWLLFAPAYILLSSPLQELLCRAIPRLFAERLEASRRSYVLLSALGFALIHAAYRDPLLLFNAFVAGLAWAAAYLETRALWPVATSHAAVGICAFWFGLA